MAFDTSIIIEVNSGGSDSNNGGGFSPTCTGFATNGAATSANTAAPVFTSASYNFISRDEGHYLFIQAGTNSRPGWWLIASTSGNAATLTATAGSGVLYNGVTPTNTTDGISNPAATLSSLTWGIDYSRKTTPGISYTDAVIDATTNTKFTSAGNPVGPNIVGNVMSVTAGTGWTVQRNQIISVSGTVATCDKAIGTTSSTGGVAGLGGAVASPGLAMSVLTQYGTIFVLGNHTFSFTSSANASGGRVSTTQPNQSIVGYTASRYHFNQDANRPVFQSNANSISLIAVNNTHCSCENIDFENGNANTAIIGWDDGSNWGTDQLWNCKFNALSVGAKVSDNSVTEFCYFLACTSTSVSPLTIGGANWSAVRDCVFSGNAWLAVPPTFLERCVFYNSSASSMTVANGKYISSCLFHTLSGTSLIIASSNSQTVTNCIFVNCTGSGSKVLDWTTLNNQVQAVNCAFFGNTADAAMPSSPNGIYSPMTGKIVLTGDPCTNAAAGDFSLNNTAGAGTLLRATGFPTTFANALTTNALDVGSAQHTASATGATAFAF